MTSTGQSTFINFFAQMTTKARVTLTRIVSSSIQTDRIFGTDILVCTLVNVDATDCQSFITVQATTHVASYSVCAVYISFTESWKLYAFVDVTALTLGQREAPFTPTFFTRVTSVKI